MGKDYHFKMSAEELQSKTIDFLRFPLIVGVVFIHANFSDIVMGGVRQISFVDYPMFSHIFILFSKIIFELCVPLFFFFSGFLFFYKTASFTTTVYLQKLKSRVRSLLLPYIFWNLLVILFLFLAQTFLTGSLISGKNKLIADYSLMDWIWSFWDISKVNANSNNSLPINSPFWFIRDLMVVVFLSPLIYFAIKKMGVYAVIVLGLFWIFNPYFNRPGLSTVSLFFFTAGAYFSIHKMNFVEAFKPMLGVLAPMYILIVAMALYFVGVGWWSYLYCAGVIAGLVLAITISAYFIESGKWHLSPFLTNSSFFIYAYHRLPLVFVIKILFKWIRPQSEGILLLLYLICPAVVILLGLLIYSLLKQCLPRFTAVISGGR